MTSFVTLVRRELWEHHNLWRVPLILLGLTLLANLSLSGAATWIGLAPPEVSSGLVAGSLGTLGSIIFVVFYFLVLFYLVDCLYAERRDKSILFWRSLPVSDTAAVLAKLAVAALVIPVILWLTIIAAQLLTLALQTIMGEGTSRLFSLIDLGRHWRNLLVVLVLTALWTLPLTTWFLFCSSWSRRTPFVPALAIPVVVILLDGLLSVDVGLGALIADRLPFGHGFGGSDQGFLLGLGAVTASHFRDIGMAELGVFLADAGLWAGLVVAAAFTGLTVWTRRWRDDS